MGGKTSTSTSSVKIPPEVLARYNAVNTRAESVAGQPFRQYSTDPNAFVAPINEQQSAGISGINQAANIARPYYDAATGMTIAGAGGVNPEQYSGAAVQRYMNPYVSNVADTTAAQMKNLFGQQSEELKGGAIRAGAFGGDRSGIAQANLANQQGLAFGKQMADIYGTGFGQAQEQFNKQQGVNLAAEQANQQRLLTAGQQIGGLGAGAQTAALQGAQAQVGAGTLEQQTEQAGKTALYNQFLQGQAYPFQVAQFLANIAMGTGALSGSTQTTTQPAPFFSDERVKDNIETIGETYDGQKIVKFNYKGDKQKQIGLIAQDVERHHPEAVGLAGGIKTVDYDGATREAAHMGKYMGGLASAGGTVVPFRAGEGFNHGGESSYAYGGEVDEALAKQAQMYATMDQGIVPTTRQLTAGIGKHGRVPEANLPVRPLMTPDAKIEQPKSAIEEGMSAYEKGAKIADMFKNAREGIGKLSEKMSPPSVAANPAAPANAAPTAAPAAQPKVEGLGGQQSYVSPEYEEEKLFGLANRGGRMQRATGGETMPYDDDPFSTKKIDIPNELPDTVLKKPDSSGTSSSGSNGLSTAIALGKMILPFFGFEEGGRVHKEGGGPTEGEADPTELAWKKIISLESGGKHFDRNGQPLTSPKGAVGIAQVMPGTAPEAARMAGVPFDEKRYLTDPDYNAALGKAYFGHQLKTFGDAEKAAAAYNAGPGRVSNAMKKASETGADWRAFLPKETRDYIAKFGSGKAPAAAEASYSPAAERANVAPEKASPSGGYVVPSEKAKDSEGFLSNFKMDENTAVPLLAGLGSMLSSRSPYLASAIGEGLLGGTAAYQAQKKLGAEVGRTQAETQKIYSDIAGNSVIVKPDGTRLYQYVKPDGTFGQMTYGEWSGLPPDQRPNIDPRALDVLRGGAGLGAGTPAPAAGAGLSGAEPKAPPANAEPVPEPVAPPAADAGIQTKPLPQETVGIEKEPEAKLTPSPIALDQEDVKAARELGQKASTLGPTFSEQNPDVFAPQEAIARNAQDAKVQLDKFATALTSLPAGGSVATTGPLAPYIRGIVGTMNQVLKGAGFNAVVNEADLKNAEKAEKIAAQLRAAGAEAGDQRSYSALADFAKNFPSIATSPEGAKELLADIIMRNQTEIDKYDYFQQWKSAAAGERGQFGDTANRTGSTLEKRFRDKFNSRIESDRQSLVEMMKTGPAGVDDPDTGRPMSWYNYITKYGPQLTPKEKSMIEKKFGDGILRIFPTVKR